MPLLHRYLGNPLLSLIGRLAVIITARFGLGEHPFLVSAIGILLGAQLIGFGVIARHLGTATGLLPRSRRLATLLSALSLERGLVTTLAIAGCTSQSTGTWRPFTKISAVRAASWRRRCGRR
jgi:hypothetical protein